MSEQKNLQTYNCAKCHDTNYESIVIDGVNYAKPCICLHAASKLKKFGIEFYDKTFANYEARSASAGKAKEILESKPLESYFIFGGVGLGKTHLLAAMYSANYESMRWTSSMIYAEHELIKSYFNGSAEQQANGKQLFMLDDLGKTKLNDYAIDRTFVLFDYFYKHRTQMIISSNYGINQVASIYGGAIARRLNDSCNIIHIDK
jgi:DNA replication protein DnaC